MRLNVRTLLSTFDHMPMLKCAVEVLITCKTRAMKKTVVVHFIRAGLHSVKIVVKFTGLLK